MEFQPDIVIAWDFSDKDCPTVNVSRLRAEKKAIALTLDVIGISHSTTGVCSVRQLLEKFEAEQRAKEEKEKSNG